MIKVKGIIIKRTVTLPVPVERIGITLSGGCAGTLEGEVSVSLEVHGTEQEGKREMAGDTGHGTPSPVGL